MASCMSLARQNITGFGSVAHSWLIMEKPQKTGLQTSEMDQVHFPSAPQKNPHRIDGDFFVFGVIIMSIILLLFIPFQM